MRVLALVFLIIVACSQAPAPPPEQPKEQKKNEILPVKVFSFCMVNKNSFKKRFTACVESENKYFKSTEEFVYFCHEVAKRQVARCISFICRATPKELKCVEKPLFCGDKIATPAIKDFCKDHKFDNVIFHEK